MTALARELLPQPPVLHEVVLSTLGLGQIERIYGHLVSGGWLVGIHLLVPVMDRGYWNTDVDLEVN